MNIGSLVVGGFFLAIAIVAYGITFTFPEALDPNSRGPAFYPQLVAMILAGLAVGVMVQAYFGAFGNADADEDGTDADGEDDAEAPRRSSIVPGLLLVFGYILTIPWMGYFIATPVFFITCALMLGSRTSIKLFGLGLSITIVLYLIFVVGFNLPLPLGVLMAGR